MGIDGFSMGNLVQTPEMSPVQIAGEAERLAAKESKYEVKTLNKSAEDNGVKRKEDEETSQESPDFNNKEETEKNEEQVKHISEEEIENGNLNDFELRLNEEKDEIELVNKKEDKILERIPASELMNVLRKVNHSSGIFVNKKI